MGELGKRSTCSSHKPNLRYCFLPQTKFDCSKWFCPRTIVYPHYPRILLRFDWFNIHNVFDTQQSIEFVFSLVFNFIIVCHFSYGRVISFAWTSHSYQGLSNIHDCWISSGEIRKQTWLARRFQFSSIRESNFHYAQENSENIVHPYPQNPSLDTPKVYLWLKGTGNNVVQTYSVVTNRYNGSPNGTEWKSIHKTQKLLALSSRKVTLKISSFWVNWIQLWRIDSRRVQWTHWKPIHHRFWKHSMDSRKTYILSVIINDPCPMESIEQHFDPLWP